MIRRLATALGLDFPPLPYCARCGGHYPAHTHYFDLFRVSTPKRPTMPDDVPLTTFVPGGHMRIRTTITTTLVAVGLLAALTACSSDSSPVATESAAVSGAKPSAPPSLTPEQRASVLAATGLPDTTPAQEAAFVAELNKVDRDIVHGKADKAASRGRSQCQTIHDWPKDEDKQADLARQRFTSPTHPEGRSLETAKKINAAAHTHLCPDF